ncbi:MAG: phosphoribosyltransferase family protein [Bacillota bacterium]
MGWGQWLLDLIYPRPLRCQGCGRVPDFEEIGGICQQCLSQIDFNQRPGAIICWNCGRRLVTNCQGKQLSRVCSDCRQQETFYDRARAVAIYRGKIRQLILQFKYQGQQQLGQPFGEMLTIYFQEYFQGLGVDLLLPIPLYPERRRERGYNQAELLARELATRTGVKLEEGLLVRESATPPLYALPQRERKQVIQGVFEATTGFKNSCVLLVDDIFTTGTTVNEASRVLKEKGADHVYVLTLATAHL